VAAKPASGAGCGHEGELVEERARDGAGHLRHIGTDGGCLPLLTVPGVPSAALMVGTLCYNQQSRRVLFRAKCQLHEMPLDAAWVRGVMGSDAVGPPAPHRADRSR
jgi:hypothetical protein